MNDSGEITKVSEIKWPVRYSCEEIIDADYKSVLDEFGLGNPKQYQREEIIQFIIDAMNEKHQRTVNEHK